MSEKFRIHLLAPAENERTRELYRSVFSEDSREFVEYYYRYKTRENRIYAAEDGNGEIVSMLHLNPYLMRQGAREAFGQYVVAVATRESCRRQGLMRSLLKLSLEDMRRAGEPFAFLMPASEAIYRPFGFRFVYNQRRADLILEEYGGRPCLDCRRAEKRDLDALSEFAEVYFQRHYQTYAIHTPEYFESLLEEQRCQKGEIVLMLERGEIRGYFFTAFEGGAEIREPVAEEGYEELLLSSAAAYLGGHGKARLLGADKHLPVLQKETPLIMARITNPEWFAAGLTADEPVELCFRLVDELLPENSGVYRFCADSRGGSMRKQEGAEVLFSVSAGELTALAFGSLSSAEAGLPAAAADAWAKVRTCAPVFLNEVV